MIVLVTGGSGGLGTCVCEELGRRGHPVAIGCLTNRAQAETTADRIESAGGRALVSPFDVRDTVAVASAVETVVATFGGLDAIVLAAARSTSSLVANLLSEKATEMYAVNVGGVLHCVSAAAPYLMASEGGRIVLFSSVIARLSSPGVAGYAATKGAIESLTRALAVELGPKGVTVNAVAPGYIRAGLGAEPATVGETWIREVLPLRRAGTAMDVAAVVSFLISAEAAYVTGTVLPVDGGLRAGSSRRSRPIGEQEEGSSR